MKPRDYILAGLEALPTLAGCIGVIGGGYAALCYAPVWMDTAVSLAADAMCAVLCGIGGGAVLAVCAMLGGRKKKECRKDTAEQLDGRDALYVGREVVCRAAGTFGRGR